MKLHEMIHFIDVDADTMLHIVRLHAFESNPVFMRSRCIIDRDRLKKYDTQNGFARDKYNGKWSSLP